MNMARGVFALLGVLVSSATLHAQVFAGPSGISMGGSIRAGGLTFGFSASPPTVRVGYTPPFFPFGFGNRSAFVQVYAPPPMPPAMAMVPALPTINVLGQPMVPPGQQLGNPFDNLPLPGVPAGGFRPVRPEDRARAQEPPEKPKVAEKPKPAAKENPKVEPPPPKPEERLPQPPQPDPDPKVESARQVALGKEAFVTQEYGRAVSRIRLAIASAPQDPMPHFLLAQTFLAMGKYSDAVDEIHAGMNLRPDWPQAKFQPREFYEPDIAVYQEHLRRLDETLAKYPADPILLFLRAHQMWFDGRKDEARALFQRAAPLIKDRKFIDQFLQTGQPIL